MPAAGELMMLSRLLIVLGVEQAVLILGVNFCSLVLRPRASMVLQGSHIMTEPRILWNTSPVHISGGRDLKALSLVWSHLFLLSEGPEFVWWWLLLRNRHSWALSLTVSSFVSSSSHLYLVSPSLGVILWPSGLSFCVCFLIFTHMMLLIPWVCFLYFYRRLRILLLQNWAWVFVG